MHATMLMGQCCVCLMGLFGSALMAAEEPIGHWTFDRLDDQTAPNAVANGQPGEVQGATLVAGAKDVALAFDGHDDYVALGDLGQFDAVTIAFWMRGENVHKTDDWQGLVTSDGWEEGVFHIGVRGGGVDVVLHLGEHRRGRLRSRSLRNGTWYNVAVVADRRQRAIRLHLNGLEEDVADLPHSLSKIDLLAQVVGREFDGSGFSRYFHGAIDDVRLYGRALQEPEIQRLCPGTQPLSPRDVRNIRTGLRIPDEGYCDQPYVVVTNDGNWLCTLTTGPGYEGAKGQHVVSTTSSDKGRTWTALVDIEPSCRREASWVVPLKVPSGRVYAFYTYNGDDVYALNGKPIRSDVHGWYAFKYTDDDGRSWSTDRYRLPMRVTACDRGNDFRGAVQMFWGIDKPNVVGSDAMFAFTKLGKYMCALGEGWFYRSDNILTESDPSKLHWELLPEGEHGVRAPEFDSVQEEHNMVPLDDGSLYCVYRTGKGYPCHAYSRDGGKSWSKPEPMTYTPGGRIMKTPRACPMLWRCKNGKFLFWFHNNPGRGGHAGPGRNPVWLSGGVEKGGKLHWSQPEILLYDPDDTKGMSYPGLIEQDGRYWAAETQKTVARVHEIDKTLLEGMWNQAELRTVTKSGLLLEAASGETKLPGPIDLRETGGVSLDLWMMLENASASQVLVDTRDKAGKGIVLTTTENGTVRIELSDGQAKAAWDSDPGLLKPGQRHHVVAIIDAGPKIITFIVDGQLCDGDASRQFGFGRYPQPLGDVSGSGELHVAPPVEKLGIYRRYLRTSEAIGNFHAGA